ncbi:hypothetical protein FGADI_12530 [Fusarium gaditjirri]|uniref:Uncharacterized protein n=1 Tax=Fusarium gaditjirri TaxID=282569 RepID=A0A8H4WN86_9HYPO|nr:hypothetical protein FGADI_12530 [Fusarium gaditjirri]
MPSSAANQSYNYGYSNSSGSSTYTGGQATSTSTSPMLNQWATTQDRTERFYVTGQKTGHGVWDGMNKTMAFERDFNGTK